MNYEVVKYQPAELRVYSSFFFFFVFVHVVGRELLSVSYLSLTLAYSMIAASQLKIEELFPATDE